MKKLRISSTSDKKKKVCGMFALPPTHKDTNMPHEKYQKIGSKIH